MMGAFSQISGMRTSGGFGATRAIPKCDDALQLLKDPYYTNMGDIHWETGETWGVLISGAVVGVAAIVLFNRYYK